MSENEKGNLRPDGFSVSVPLPPPFGVSGAYYWNPGSATAPHWTLTPGLGIGGGGAHLVFLRKGMTSQDTLGYGASANIAPTIFPSATVNASIPDENSLPRPWDAKVSSVEAGIGLPGFSAGYTITPQQAADFINRYIFSPAAGPQDELPPFLRSLQSGFGTFGLSESEPPAGLLTSRRLSPFGDGVGSWSSSVAPTGPLYAAPPREACTGLGHEKG